MKWGEDITPPANGQEICAIVLTYRPDGDFPTRLARIHRQVGLVAIVNDGASEADTARLCRWFENYPRLIMHHLKNNDGIPLCLNIGFDIAKRNGYEWVMVFDDDTTVFPNMVERLISHLGDYRADTPVAVCALSWREVGDVKEDRAAADRGGWVEKRAVIGSGGLYSLKAHEIIGPWPNDYFLGCTDYEYCLRARAKGFRVIRFTEIGFEQRLGRPSTHRLGPFTFKTYNYSAPRYYYAFRNNWANASANALRDPLFCVAVFIYFFRAFLTVGMFESDRGRKARFMLRGLWHGIIRKMGKTITDE